MKKIRMALFWGVLMMCLQGCSSETNQYSPDQVIQNALGETTPAYYGEVELIINDQGEKTGEIMQEWRSNDGKIRIDSQNLNGNDKIISVNNRNVLTLYEIDQNRAYIIDDPEVLSFNQPSPKEQINRLLEVVRDTHEITTAGEAKILGRDTHRLLAKAKESDTLFGNIELWIDKETWLVLKTVQHMGDTIIEMNYTKIDFDAKMSPDLFTIDLPEDVEMENLLAGLETKEITLEEIPTEIGEPVIYFPETEELKISKIESYEYQGELNGNEVSLDYTKNDLPFLTFSVFETVNEDIDDVEMKTIEIRNQEGFYMELADFRSVFWDENGFTYSIVFIDPNLTLEEFLEMTEEMELIK